MKATPCRSWITGLLVAFATFTAFQQPKRVAPESCPIPVASADALAAWRDGNLPLWRPGGIRLSPTDQRTSPGVDQVVLVSEEGITRESEGADLILSHVADGSSPEADIRIETALVLVNTSNRVAEIDVRFFNENGTPMEVTIDGVTDSHFALTLLRGRTARLRTSGEGPVTVGWASVHMTQPVAATATFTITDSAGELDAEVGVSTSRLFSHQSVFVESNSFLNTGLAIVNPDASGSNLVELIFRGMDGVEIERQSIELETRGKRSQFVTQYFPSLVNSTFAGVIDIRAEKPIAVMALRQRGRHLTSLPSIREYDVDEAAAPLHFYRIGAGRLDSTLLETAFIVVNNSDQVAQIALELFQETGDALSVDLDGTRSSVFNSSVPPRGALRITASETGAMKVGWGRLSSDQAVGAVATFTQFSVSGPGPPRFHSEVGVQATIPFEDFVVFADTMDGRGTAIALSNISDDEACDVSMELNDSNYRFLRRISLRLQPGEHIAKFVSELFKEEPEIQGPFEGSVAVSGPTIIGGTLRLAGNFMTSFPIMIPLHGFQPRAKTEFANTLGDTAPASVFHMQQFAGDMTLERVDIQIDEVGFDKSVFEQADSWVLFGDTGVSQSSTLSALGSIDSIDDAGSVHVRLDAIREDRLSHLGDIVFSGSPEGGFRAEISLANRYPNTYAYADFYLRILVPSGILKLPGEDSTVHVETELTSVSRSQLTEQRLVEHNSQEIYLKDFPDTAPRLLQAAPFRTRSQSPLVIVGENLGDVSTLEVLFTSTSSSEKWQSATILYSEDNVLIVQVPEAIRSGPIILRQDGGKSNEYQFDLAFGPLDDFSLEAASGESVNLTASLSQEPGQLQYLNWHTTLQNAELNLSGLAVDQTVATGTHKDGYYESSITFQVESIESDRVTIFDPDYELRFQLVQQAEGGVLIENVIEEEPLEPQLVFEPYAVSWTTTVPLLRLSGAVGQPITADVVKTSVRSSASEHSKYKTFSHYTFEF
jgi:hypothetical protein